MDPHDYLFLLLALQDQEIDGRRVVAAARAIGAGVSRTAFRDELVRLGILTRDRCEELLTTLAKELERVHWDGARLRSELTAAVSPAASEALRADGADAKAPVEPDPLHSDQFSDRELHAKGGLGEVWRVRDRFADRIVALKRIRSDRNSEPDTCQRFMHEARITARLEHPNVVPVYQLFPGSHGVEPFYVMPFLKGETLFESIRRFHEQHLTPEEWRQELHRQVGRLIDACKAVAYAHAQGVVHRDIKPANIMLGEFGGVFVVDWGLAKDGFHSEEGDEPPIDDEHGRRIGTPAWMSPEQAGGCTELIDRRTDIYALGGVLFAILTGSAPHTRWAEHGKPGRLMLKIVQEPTPRVRDFNTAAPASLAAVCGKAMAKEPNERYSSVADFMLDLERWRAGENVSAVPETWTHRLARRAIARPTRSVLVSAVVVILLSCGLLAAAAVLVNQYQARRFADAALAERCTHAERVVQRNMKNLERDLDVFASLPGIQKILSSGPDDFQGAAARAILNGILTGNDVFLELSVVRQDDPTKGVFEIGRGPHGTMSEMKPSIFGTEVGAWLQSKPQIPTVFHLERPVVERNQAPPVSEPIVDTFAAAPIRSGQEIIGYVWLRIDVSLMLRSFVDMHRYSTILLTDDVGNVLDWQKPQVHESETRTEFDRYKPELMSFIADDQSDNHNLLAHRGAVVIAARRLQYEMGGRNHHLGVVFIVDLDDVDVGPSLMLGFLFYTVAAVIAIVALLSLIAWRVLLRLGRSD